MQKIIFLKWHGIYNEILYVFRLLWPICFLFVIYISKLDYKRAIKAISISVFIISSVIVLTNIFKISYIAYSSDKELIQDNIFSWFNNALMEYDYTKLTSKGLFTGANEIGAVLLLTIPIVLYNSSKKNISIFDIGILLQIVAMIMLGSRTAALGWIVVYILTLILYLVMQIIRKHKINIIFLVKCVIIGIIGIILLLNSPIIKRYEYLAKYENAYKENMQNAPSLKTQYAKRIINGENLVLEYASKVQEGKLKLNSNTDSAIFTEALNNNDVEKLRTLIIEDYIESTYEEHYISDVYIKNIYPYTEDSTFWLEVFDMPFKIKSDNRELGQLIAQRMKKLNNNAFLDTMLGTSYSTLKSRNVFIEKDFISHYFSLGLIGMLLFVCPYMIILIVEIITIVKNYKSKLWVHNLVMCTSLLIAILIGFWGGHLFDEYIASFYVALIAALLFKNINYIAKK